MKILRYDEIDSTNAFLTREASQRSLPSGFVVIARSQTQGRGRLGRSWTSEKGNLFFSVYLNIQDMRLASQLSFVVSIAIFETLKHFLPETTPLKLKWPNDVLIDGAKVSGILLEPVDSAFQEGIVIGIGLNLCSAPALDRKTTSLSEHMKSPPLRSKVFSLTLRNLFCRIQQWETNEWSHIRAQWLQWTYQPGTKVLIEGEKYATFHGITPEGFLIVADDEKEIVVRSGDVMWL